MNRFVLCLSPKQTCLKHCNQNYKRLVDEEQHKEHKHQKQLNPKIKETQQTMYTQLEDLHCWSFCIKWANNNLAPKICKGMQNIFWMYGQCSFTIKAQGRPLRSGNRWRWRSMMYINFQHSSFKGLKEDTIVIGIANSLTRFIINEQCMVSIWWQTLDAKYNKLSSNP